MSHADRAGELGAELRRLRTSANEDAARNATFGTQIPQASVRPRSRPRCLGLAPGAARLFAQRSKQETLTGGCPHAEPPTNGACSLEREPVVLKGRRGERESF
jgi:hypothetical protein